MAFEVASAPPNPTSSNSTPAGSAGPSIAPAPRSRNEWLWLLTRSSDLKQFGIALAWGWHGGFVAFSPCCARPPRPAAKAKRSSGLFPCQCLGRRAFHLLAVEVRQLMYRFCGRRLGGLCLCLPERLTVYGFIWLYWPWTPAAAWKSSCFGFRKFA